MEECFAHFKEGLFLTSGVRQVEPLRCKASKCLDVPILQNPSPGPVKQWILRKEYSSYGNNGNSERPYFLGLQTHRTILKSKDITLPTKVHPVKAVVFPVVMYGCESWTTEKAECQRIDAFELWCWRRLLRVPWTARRFNQSILDEIVLNILWKGWCWNWNPNTLATWCKVLTHWKRPWCWKRLKVGGEGDNGGWEGWMASPTQWAWVWGSSGSWLWTEKPGVLQSMRSQRTGHNLVTVQQKNPKMITEKIDTFEHRK